MMSVEMIASKPCVAPGWMLDAASQSHGLSILLHPTKPRWALVNATGVMLAGLMDGTRTTDEIADVMAELYGPSSDFHSDVEAFENQLRQSGLLSDDMEESVGEEAPIIPSLTIYLTEQCNLRCKHCAIVEGRMPQTKMDATAVRRLIDEHTGEFPQASVTFLGGEPLLHPDCMDLLEYATGKAERVTICTNGLLLTDELITRLVELGVEIQVSLDGADAEGHDAIRGKGTFDKTWRAIEALAAAGAGAKLTIATTLTRSVVNSVQELVARLDRLGVGMVRFLPLTKTRAAETNWDKICPEPAALASAVWWVTFDASARPGAVTKAKGGFPGYSPTPPQGRHWCPLGKTFIVDSQGETYVCPSLTTKQVQGGNALTSGMKEVAGGTAAREARDWMLGRRDRVSECRQCAWRNFCQGGCLAFMGHLSGSFDKNDDYCEFRRNMYRRTALSKARINWSPENLLGSPIPHVLREGATQ